MNTQPSETDALLTTRQVADYLQMRYLSIRNMARTKRLPGYFVGNRWRFRRSEIDHWLEQHRNPETPETADE